MPESRRPYARPEVVRVDLVEDEIALSTCKTQAPQTKAKGAFPGGCQKKSCKNNGSS